MKTLKVLLLAILPSSLFAADYVFKVDENLNAYVSDTIRFEGDKMVAYQDAKSWFVEQKWTAQVLNDVMGEKFDFKANLMTKSRYNPIIHTLYSDFIAFDGLLTVEDDRVIVSFNNIQFGESVQGLGQRTSTQPLSQKLHKLEKEKIARDRVASDESMDKKSKKKELSKHDDVIKDIEDSLKEIDEEIRVRLANLKKSL